MIIADIIEKRRDLRPCGEACMGIVRGGKLPRKITCARNMKKKARPGEGNYLPAAAKFASTEYEIKRPVENLAALGAANKLAGASTATLAICRDGIIRRRMLVEGM